MGGQGRVQVKGQELRHMPLIWSAGGVIWGSQAKSRSVNSNQKEWDLGILRGNLI